MSLKLKFGLAHLIKSRSMKMEKKGCYKNYSHHYSLGFLDAASFCLKAILHRSRKLRRLKQCLNHGRTSQLFSFIRMVLSWPCINSLFIICFLNFGLQTEKAFLKQQKVFLWYTDSHNIASFTLCLILFIYYALVMLVSVLMCF